MTDVAATDAPEGAGSRLSVVLGVSRRHRRLQGLRAAAPVHRVRPRRHGRPDRRRPAVRRCCHLGGAVRQAGQHRGLDRRPRGAARPDRPVGRPRRGGARHGRPAGPAAHGRADDLLTNILLTARCPVVFAPAMHTEMWEHPATQANVATLRERGALVIEPAVGRLTGADTGKGRLPEPDEIFALCQRRAGPWPTRRRASAADLAGRTGRGLRRRHPRAARPGALPRQPVLGAAGLWRWPAPRPRAAPT